MDDGVMTIVGKGVGTLRRSLLDRTIRPAQVNVGPEVRVQRICDLILNRLNQTPTPSPTSASRLMTPNESIDLKPNRTPTSSHT